MKRCELSGGILVYLNGGELWLSSLPTLFILPPRVPLLSNQTSNPIRVSLEKTPIDSTKQQTLSCSFFSQSVQGKRGGVYPSWILGRFGSFSPGPPEAPGNRERGKKVLNMGWRLVRLVSWVWFFGGGRKGLKKEQFGREGVIMK